MPWHQVHQAQGTQSSVFADALPVPLFAAIISFSRYTDVIRFPSSTGTPAGCVESHVTTAYFFKTSSYPVINRVFLWHQSRQVLICLKFIHCNV